jgi:hypothetical protein
VTGPRRVKNLWVWMLAAAVISAIVILWGRWQVEKSNNTVELVMDYRAAKLLCQMADYPLDTFLRQAKDRGLTSVAVGERTIKDIAALGQVYAFSGRQILDYDRLSPVGDPVLRRMIDESRLSAGNSYLFPRDHGLFQDLVEILPVRLEGERISAFSSQRLGSFLETARGVPDLEKVNIGLDPEAACEVSEAGLRVVARFRNYPGVTPHKIGVFLNGIPYKDSVSLVIFEGAEILGYPDYLSDVRDLMVLNSMAFGQVEFASQTGDSRFARLMGQEVIRVHSITEREMEKIPFDKAVERFTRAARERNMRAMYIRPFPAEIGDAGAIDKNLSYVQAIREGLEESGFSIGQARPFKEYTPSRYIMAIVGAGILASSFILLDTLFSLQPVIELGLFGLGIILYSVLLSTGYATIVRQLAALGGAIVFPVLAVGVLYSKSLWKGHTGEGVHLKDAVLLWLESSAISIVGGLLVAGALSSGTFMLSLDKFIGVKAAHVIPIVLGAVVCWIYLVGWEQLQDDSGHGVLASIGDLLNAPLRIWHVLALAVVALGGLVYILRTGNFYLGLPIPQFDEGMRRFLEDLLVFRPRTKEFLIGHPALLFSATLALSGYFRLSLPLVLVGCIAQISMINTFSHIHTPIMATLQRTFYGLMLGGIIGIVISAVFIHLSEKMGSDERVPGGEDFGE